MVATFNGSGSSLTLNGTTVSGLNTSTSNLSSGIRIGAHSSSDYLKGSIAEFLIINESVILDTKKQIEGYLAHKWGLTNYLSTQHTYKTTAPQTGFHYVSSNSDILEINGTNAIIHGSAQLQSLQMHLKTPPHLQPFQSVNKLLLRKHN